MLFPLSERACKVVKDEEDNHDVGAKQNADMFVHVTIEVLFVCLKLFAIVKQHF